MLLCTVMAGTMLASCGEKKEEADKELVLYTWEGLFPQEVLNKYKLGSSANVKNIKNALEKKELIDILPDSITLQDPVFKHWLLTKY